jgi:hypothetical protein
MKSLRINLNLERARAEIIYHRFQDVEAKTISLQDLNIRSYYNPEIQVTGIDDIIVVSGFGSQITYVDGYVKTEKAMTKAVTSVKKPALNREAKKDEEH